MMTAEQVKSRLNELREGLRELTELSSFVNDNEQYVATLYNALLREQQALHTALALYVKEKKTC